MQRHRIYLFSSPPARVKPNGNVRRPTRSTVWQCAATGIRFALIKETTPPTGPFYRQRGAGVWHKSFIAGKLGVRFGIDTSARHDATHYTPMIETEALLTRVVIPSERKTPQHFRRSIRLSVSFPLHRFLAASVVPPQTA
jgi:hypothetical protein